MEWKAKTTSSHPPAGRPLIAHITTDGEADAVLRRFTKSLETILEDSVGRSFESKCFRSFEDFAAYLGDNAIPHLLLIHHPSYLPPLCKPASLRSVFSELRRNDPNIGIFLFCAEMPMGPDLMTWFDAGATALLESKNSGAGIDEALEELLYRRLNNQERRRVRLPSTQRLDLQVPSLQQAMVAETLNLGTGGMFVRARPKDFTVGDRIDFALRLDPSSAATLDSGEGRPAILAKLDESADGPGVAAPEIRGTGQVVWVRSDASPDLPEGIGLRFVTLEADGQMLIDEFVKKHGTRAFIPKA